MSDYKIAEDVMNRGLQRCGAPRIVSRTDDSKSAGACNFVYDKLREAELRRNVWRFAIRKTVLRPLTTGVVPPTASAWSSVTTYNAGDVVTNGGNTWYSTAGGNLNNTPTLANTFWGLYNGNTLYIAYPTWAIGTTYAANSVVAYGGETWYSPAGGNVGNTPSLASAFWFLYFGSRVAQPWDHTLAYYAGEIAYINNVAYLSLINGNSDVPPTANWLTLTSATLTATNFIYPIGAGPTTQQMTRNVYMLPNGFLREAPQDPKAGSTSFLGAPAGLAYTDWEYESNYFVSNASDAIVFRFVANISDVLQMDPLFCEGLASRIALEVCEELTQSGEKLQSIGATYNRFMGEARTVNGIETGPTEPPEDDFIQCRK